MTLKIQRLDWDSEFFGFGVGRLSGSLESAAALSRTLRDATEYGIVLVYGQCAHVDLVSHQLCLESGGRFVDAKRRYTLPLADVHPVGEVGAQPADAGPYSRRQLRTLAWQSAEFSRYRIDPDMPPGAWRRLYSSWIANSLNGKLADAVLVEREASSEGGRIAAMVTVSHRGTQGAIGLFAVDARWRRRGIGRRLLEAAAAQCRTTGCTELAVVTQGDNDAACRAYESAGYALVDEQHIFHFWSHRP